MAYATITKPSLHFNTVTYTGNGGTNAITGVGFQPDMVWTKNRSSAQNHLLYDAVRGIGYYLYPNLTNAQGGNGTSALVSFDSDGFTLDGGDDSNVNGQNGVAWSWKAGNSAGSSNSDGSITSTVSANPTAGFSICKYTGTGATATIGPVFSVGTSTGVNNNGDNHIAYCFAEKAGFSKFGSYKGNGNANGTFVYTGFKPAFFLCKNSSTSNTNWLIFDNKRAPQNLVEDVLKANLNSAGENGDLDVDFLSNGVKMRNTDGNGNENGSTMIYMAFAEEPLVANVGQGIPATAR